MVILGIDPGTLATGYGVLQSRGGLMRLLASGCVKNSPGTKMPDRLKHIYESLSVIIHKHKPDECAIETAFYGKNAQSALKLGQARGVSILAAVIHHLPTSEYSPREVKRALVGNGSASKQQVHYMVNSLLKTSPSIARFDVTDAIAVAMCHINRFNKPAGGFRDWKSFVSAHPERLSGSAK